MLFNSQNYGIGRRERVREGMRKAVRGTITVISPGSRVLLAYLLSPFPAVGVKGIRWAIPVGWLLADTVGILFIRRTMADRFHER